MKLKEKYTIVIVTHNMQQAVRISDQTAFFLLGELIEYSDTDFFNLRRFGQAAPVDLLAQDRGELPADSAAAYRDGRNDFSTRVRVAAVFVGPGAMALTRMPSDAISAARLMVIELSAALATP